MREWHRRSAVAHWGDLSPVDRFWSKVDRSGGPDTSLVKDPGRSVLGSITLADAIGRLPDRGYLHTFLGIVGATWERGRIIEALCAHSGCLVEAPEGSWPENFGHRVGISGYGARGSTLWIEALP